MAAAAQTEDLAQNCMMFVDYKTRVCYSQASAPRACCEAPLALVRVLVHAVACTAIAASGYKILTKRLSRLQLIKGIWYTTLQHEVITL